MLGSGLRDGLELGILLGYFDTEGVKLGADDKLGGEVNDGLELGYFDTLGALLSEGTELGISLGDLEG